VNFAAKTLKLYASKTEEEREVGLVPRLSKALRAHRAEMNVGSDDAEVFGHLTYTKLRDDFTAACEAARIKDLRLHDLRHTRATRWTQGGLMESEVAHLLGHSEKSQVTRRYINPDERTIARSIVAAARFTKEHGRGRTKAKAGSRTEAVN
jgi:integrase